MKAPVGWAALSVFLFEAASRDLAGINGAFGLTTGEWAIICFSTGIVFAVLAALKASKS